ncbi:hypothetical protein OQZ33_13280 [Pedobacter sp. MC2016-05]|uniref:hypothetical protein n=1 Tax=Pedobacter sp. MC2016-05 TaxID=2994474 RepID=UPI002246A9E9|nr:hypothetical protein [Pedobacter sp. MC2016-05]MCX2475303.1 hypothetical protein [Pedobacter sp. MC2016-05]
MIGAVNDVISTVAGVNDPKFVNYSLNTAVSNADFNTSWDFHIQGNSPALSKGITSFTRHHAGGMIMKNGITYTSPAPAGFVGAYGIKN